MASLGFWLWVPLGATAISLGRGLLAGGDLNVQLRQLDDISNARLRSDIEERRPECDVRLEPAPINTAAFIVRNRPFGGWSERNSPDANNMEGGLKQF